MKCFFCFLTLATESADIPVLSLDAFAQQKVVSQLTKVEVRTRDGASPLLEAYVLPPDVSWPFFHSGKMRRAEDQHVLVRRVHGRNAVRDQEVLSAANKVDRSGDSPVIVGSPGTGKTCLMNYYLLEFVRHIGEPGWKKIVMARYGSTFVKIYREESTGELQCEQSTVNSWEEMESITWDFWHNLSREERAQIILLLDLEENETNPKTGGVGSIATSANGDASNAFRAWENNRSLKWFMNEPQSEEEAQGYVRLFNAASSSGNKYDWENVVRPRWEIIPRAREFLSRDPLIQDFPGSVLKDLCLTFAYDVPLSVSDIVAPYFVSEATGGGLLRYDEIQKKHVRSYRFKLFNLESAVRIGKCIDFDDRDREEHWYFVESSQFRWQLEQAFVAYGGLLEGKEDMVSEEFTRAHWKWFTDKGPGKNCTKKALEAPPIALPQCDSLRSFAGQHLDRTAGEMTEGVLYHSDRMKSPLVDFLFKHEDTVYAVQVSSHACQENKLKLDNLAMFLDRLGLLSEEEQRKHKLVFLFVMGDDVSSSEGIGVVKGSSKGEEKTVSLKTAISELAPQMKFSSHLIRAKILPRHPPRR